MQVKVETLILFGATGDLAQRMLFPSLYNLYADGLFDDGLGGVGGCGPVGVLEEEEGAACGGGVAAEELGVTP